MNNSVHIAKQSLDKIIKKSRVHFYKPIQIAEILYYQRTHLYEFDTANLATYRNISKRWRDLVSTKLVGRVSTSSQKYQDNLFENNALPPHQITALSEYNLSHNGIVENYIYHQFRHRLRDVIDAFAYLQSTKHPQFELTTFLDFFEMRPGLKRSVGKAYEIIVYALFSTLVQALKAQVSITLDNPDKEILTDFRKFVSYVFGIPEGQSKKSNIAQIYRGGVTNAADRGLDMWTNFGPIVQVKHLRLDESLADDIAENVITDDVVIVCRDADESLIISLLNQVGIPIRGIITFADLKIWYALCTQKYPENMGTSLIQNLRQEFLQEFPILGEIDLFLQERGYDPNILTHIWEI